VRVAPLSPGVAGAWSALFEACGCACHCRYWHFEGGKNDWLARCFEQPERNRDEQLALLAAGATEARGLVAMEGDLAIGWMKLAPRDALPKLLRLGPYRALDLGEAGGVHVIGCLLVRPDRRRRGVARALVEAADAQVLAWGGRAIEAFPHRASHDLRDEEAWMGPEGLFRSLGYEAVHGDGPYPVLRKVLGRGRVIG